MNRFPFRATTWLSLVVALLACNSRPLPAVAELLPSTSQPSAPAAEIDERHLLGYLASDELEGRGIGSKGLDRAADYIVEQFTRAGLQIAPGMSGFFQPFEMTTSTSIGDHTTLRSGPREYKLRDEFSPLGFSAEGAIAGPVVFVGYGVISDAHHYDDYANIDVKGKIVLAMRFEPHDDKGNSKFEKEGWSDDATLTAKAKAAKDHGAAALIVFTPSDFRSEDRLMSFTRSAMEPVAAIPVIQVRTAVAEEMLRRAGEPDSKALEKQIDQALKQASRELKDIEISGNVELRRAKATVKNVVGYLPGKNRDEYLVVGAHYDHLGRGGPGSLKPRSHEIHNGADDNASGTTAIIETASLLARQSSPPARSVIFVAFTGEEEGLFGSKWFVEHSPVPLAKIVAMINLDMVGRVREAAATQPAAITSTTHPLALTTQVATQQSTQPTTQAAAPTTQTASGILYIGGAGTAAAFDAIVKNADDHSPLQLKDMGRGGFGPSDHMSFALKHIPVLFLFSGMHADYHRPTDDADKINYAGLDEVAKLTADLVTEIAAQPKQTYIAAADASSPQVGVTHVGSRVTFGVVPDYTSTETSGGVRISGTSPGTPAEKAGLKEGDVITEFAGKSIDNLYDLTNVLAKHKAGDVVMVKLLRAGKPTEVEATLAERK